MTGGELIKILEKYPKSATIVLWGENNTEGNDLLKCDIDYDEAFNEVTINYDK
jgi:hypothetical protein